MDTTSFEARSSGYFIKDGYRVNGTVITHEGVSGEAYWTQERLKLSLCYQYPVYKFACSLLQAGGINRVIDVGCGVGTKLEMLHDAFPHVEIIGIDQPSTIGFCQKHHRFGRWIADDLEQPGTATAGLTGDLVICADVIEHMGDPDILLRYLKQRTAPGGRILLSTPERDLLRGRACNHSPNRYHVREWNRAELTAYLSHAGFSIVEHRLQLPVKGEFGRVFFTHVLKRALMGKPIRWNQACLLEVR